MKQLKYQLSILFITLVFCSFGQKKPIDQSAYTSWNNIDHPVISNNGEWVSYEINPQKGDGNLVITNKENNFTQIINRGCKTSFSPNNKFITFKITAPKDTIRKAKFDKKKNNEMPKDSLGIYVLSTRSLTKIPGVKSIKTPQEESEWIAYLHEKEGEGKSKGSKLVVFNPISSQKFEYQNVTEYTISKNGKILGIISSSNDSTKENKVFVFETATQRSLEILNKAGECKKIACDNKGTQLAFIYSSDTISNKRYDLYYWNTELNYSKLIVEKDNKEIPKGWCINKYTYNYFSKDGNKLFFKTAPIVKEEPKDTLLQEEKISVDIWNWKDEKLQPQQKVELEDEKERTYQAVYHIKESKVIQLCDKSIKNIRLPSKEGDYGLGKTIDPYSELFSWKFVPEYDFYLINLNTGERKKIIEKLRDETYISPNGNYIAYYNTNDSAWYSYSTNKNKTFPLTNGIPVNFYDEEHDYPEDPDPYGIAGWVDDNKSILIYDQYDVWKIDLENKTKPVNITDGFGRKKKITFNYVKLDSEKKFINKDEKILLTGFNKITKDEGFFLSNLNEIEKPVELIYDAYNFNYPIKAKDSNTLLWKKESFVDFGNLWISDINFNNARKISDANPQQKDYLWGTIDLVEWKSYDDIKLQGLFYKPENFDPSKKYPMIVHFYRRRSKNLNKHYIPKPSGEEINITNYVSNGYLVFVPEIIYKIGYPGKSAYNAIISGTKAMIKKYKFVDSENIGIQGWSWGAYQTAYLITQTNLYKAAMATSLVCNMTSAYGGIRWRSGMSRMFQYEGGQSRIGGTLWKNHQLYIENSPLFYAPEVKTPLLMMHNDKDGAVPWYQSIEFFVALQRLNKPAWLLVYNNEKHSINNWPNKVDFEIRMMQFFDHYLKGKPEPVWMKEGIPAIKKGKEFGYELNDN